MTRKYQRTQEQEQRFNVFKAVARELEGEINQGKQSEETQQLSRHAQSQPGLQRYSQLNQLLILKQQEGATEVHTFRGWRELGQRVKKGSKAIYIRAPREPGEGEEGITGFRTMLVFDKSQVEPIKEQQPGSTPDGSPEEGED
jgi:hypothetical protein